MWYNYFDRICLINLPERTERLRNAEEELKTLNASYVVIPAIRHEIGSVGLWLTLLGLFERAEKEDWNNILIFEDDVQFSQENYGEYLAAQVKELKALDWDLFYLGGNVFTTLYPVDNCDYLLGSTGIMSTHALAYSKQGWKLVLQEMRRIVSAGITEPEAIDLLLHRVIQPRGKTYVSFPMLCVQRPGWSDVENRETDYKNLIQDRYNKALKELM